MPAKANIAKWDQLWRKFRPSLTLQIYHQSAVEKIAKRAKHHISKRCKPLLLDAGCGQGQLSVLLAERTGFNIVALDIIEAPLHTCKSLVAERKLEGQVSLVRASVYQLPFRDGIFDIAVSTGSESAAAYPAASEEVSRAVVNGGLLFIDFTRMPNLYQPIISLKGYFKYKKACKRLREGIETKTYHYGKLGLKKRFEDKLGLRIEQIWRMNTSPPFVNKRLRLLFDKTLGKLMSPLLARTILVEMRKTKARKLEA